MSFTLVCYLPGAQRPRGDTIIFTAGDMFEAAKFPEAIMELDTL